MHEASQSAAALVNEGSTLASSLVAAGAFPKVFTDCINSAECAGSLDQELARWAKTESDFAIAAHQKAAERLPRIMYIIVVLWVGLGIIRFFTGYVGQITKMADF